MHNRFVIFLCFVLSLTLSYFFSFVFALFLFFAPFISLVFVFIAMVWYLLYPKCHFRKIRICTALRSRCWNIILASSCVSDIESSQIQATSHQYRLICTCLSNSIVNCELCTVCAYTHIQSQTNTTFRILFYRLDATRTKAHELNNKNVFTQWQNGKNNGKPHSDSVDCGGAYKNRTLARTTQAL